MLRASISFFVIGLLAFVLGANNIAGISMDLGRGLLFLFVLMAAVSFLVTLITGRKARIGSLCLTLVMVGIMACSHGPTVQDYPDTASASDEVAKVEEDMGKAFSNQVNVLSPASFQEAQEYLDDAKASLAKKSDSKDTLHLVAKSRAYLNRSYGYAEVAQTNMKEVIVARHQAILAGAPHSMADAFRKADYSLMEATSDIERGKLQSTVDGRTQLQLTYLDLELKGIKLTRLGESRKIIAQALKEGAQEFAPQSLAIAEKSVQETDAFITSNRHDDGRITLRSGESNKKSQHLLKITRSSKLGRQGTSEEQALKLDAEENKVATNQKQLALGASVNQGLTDQNVHLEGVQALNRRYEAARAEFSESEAEVYKQGNTLMIRLRGLEFPVSQAVLRDSNFALLSKVQKVINDFGKSSVIVEGHTDSNGGLANNQKLSSARALAVTEYFRANSIAGQPMNVRAVGYGYQKPLATNRTAGGRAQNRRVDVLIQPEQNSTDTTTN